MDQRQHFLTGLSGGARRSKHTTLLAHHMDMMSQVRAEINARAPPPNAFVASVAPYANMRQHGFSRCLHVARRWVSMAREHDSLPPRLSAGPLSHQPGVDAALPCRSALARLPPMQWVPAARVRPQQCAKPGHVRRLELGHSVLGGSGCLIFYHGCLFHWFSKMQKSVSLSSAEAEYFGAMMAARDLIFARDLVLIELAIPLEGPSVMWSDSKSAVDMSRDPVAFKMTKHILRAAEFLRDLVARLVIEVRQERHLPGRVMNC